MNDNVDSAAGPLQPRDFINFNRRPVENPHVNGNGNGKSPNGSPNGHSQRRNFDIWMAIDILAKRWHWLVIGAVIGTGALFLAGWNYVQPKFTAEARLLRYDTPGVSDFLKAAPATPETFAALISSPELLQRVGNKCSPPVPPEVLNKELKVDPDADSDVVKIYVTEATPQKAVALANLYLAEVVDYTRELQATQAAQVVKTYLEQQITGMDKDISALRDKFRTMPASDEVTNKLAQVGGQLNALNQSLASGPEASMLISEQTKRLQTALAELSELTLKYTDQHPAVVQKREQIASLQNQIAAEAKNNPGGEISITSSGQVLQPDLEVIRTRLRSLEDARVQMTSRQREAELFASNPPGVIRMLAPADPISTKSGHRRVKITLLSAFGGFAGMGFGLLLLLLAEVTDKHLHTAHDVQRITRLPVLTTLGNLEEMPQDARDQWAFRTWTLLQGRLSRSQNHGLVCGVTSSTDREGRSTWINMMAEAASMAGFRVLTIATRPSPAPTHIECPDAAPNSNNNGNDMKPEEKRFALASSILSSPGQITDQLTGSNAKPVVNIPLPGWVWNLERRKQWRDALNHWRKIENLVIFVELPPASVPEAVMLGSNLPNLIWLSESGTAQAGETRAQLETLRNARCNLVGAVLNREPAKSLKSRFPRWIGCLALFAALQFSVRAQDTSVGTNSTVQPQTNTVAPAAATSSVPSSASVVPSNTSPPHGKIQFYSTPDGDTTPPPAPAETEADTNLTFSVVHPRLAPWQQHMTLGAGDVLTFGLYGEPDLTRREVAIGPDGRVSYLEAEDIQAGGLTVDELRQKLDDALGQYRRSPRTMIIPVAFHSKKYFVLGQVMQRGVYTLDRPITVVEALARAHGIISGQIESDSVDLADLPRSFLMRSGHRMSVDFEKLFAGDLSQNVAIEPGDYLCFPSAGVQSIYVLGEVALPGPVVFRPDSTAISVISSRGGFSEKAYKSKILVLRGSLNHPETFVVNVWDIVHGHALDFKLQPRDIVYVSWRPFSYGEDVLDLAITSFTQAIVTGWVGTSLIQP